MKKWLQIKLHKKKKKKMVIFSIIKNTNRVQYYWRFSNFKRSKFHKNGTILLFENNCHNFATTKVFRNYFIFFYFFSG